MDKIEAAQRIRDVIRQELYEGARDAKHDRGRRAAEHVENAANKLRQIADALERSGRGGA